MSPLAWGCAWAVALLARQSSSHCDGVGQSAFISARGPLSSWVMVRRPAIRRGPRRAASCAVSAEQAISGFDELGLQPALKEVVGAFGFESPTDIQKLSFPVVMMGQDAVLAAEAGSGKTLAYLLPLFQRILTGSLKGQVLVLVPNRDLMLQVCQVARHFTDLTQLTCAPLDNVAPSAAKSMHMLVGTPMLAEKRLSMLQNVKVMVLDEADMLLAGMWKQTTRNNPMNSVLGHFTESKTQQRARLKEAKAAGKKIKKKASKLVQPQYVFASATVPTAGSRSVGNFIDGRFPGIRWVYSTRVHQPIQSLDHRFVQVDLENRTETLLGHLSQAQSRKLVFANTVKGAKEVHGILQRAGVEAATFHPDVSPEERTRLLKAFHKGKVPILVCSGLAARGIDFQDVELVIQYQMAQNVVEHMHRVGRTARAGKPGQAISLYTNSEAQVVEHIRHLEEDGLAYLE